jgi:hypothetical protein
MGIKNRFSSALQSLLPSARGRKRDRIFSASHWGPEPLNFPKFWRRREPMTEDEAEMVNEDPRLKGFFTPGSDLDFMGFDAFPLVLVRFCGDSLSLGVDTLRERYDPVRRSDRVWSGEVVPIETVRFPEVRTDVRKMSPGDKLDDIPLIRCPVCKRTAFTLGKNLDYLGRPSKHSSYAHVVGGLTKNSGSILVYCDEDR